MAIKIRNIYALIISAILPMIVIGCSYNFSSAPTDTHAAGGGVAAPPPPPTKAAIPGRFPASTLHSELIDESNPPSRNMSAYVYILFERNVKKDKKDSIINIFSHLGSKVASQKNTTYKSAALIAPTRNASLCRNKKDDEMTGCVIENYNYTLSSRLIKLVGDTKNYKLHGESNNILIAVSGTPLYLEYNGNVRPINSLSSKLNVFDISDLSPCTINNWMNDFITKFEVNGQEKEDDVKYIHQEFADNGIALMINLFNLSNFHPDKTKNICEKS